jgi:hypothetical protein
MDLVQRMSLIEEDNAELREELVLVEKEQNDKNVRFE